MIQSGIPIRGMPPFDLKAAAIANLIGYLRTMRRPVRSNPDPVALTVGTTDVRKLEGLAIGRSFDDLILRTKDDRIHLLRKAASRYRQVNSQVDWPMYDGGFSGNSHTNLKQIEKTNVARLAPQWIHSLPDTGVMYVTSLGQCSAWTSSPVARSGITNTRGPAVTARSPPVLIAELLRPETRSSWSPATTISSP